MKKALILVALLVVLPAGLVLADIAFQNTIVRTHSFSGPIDEIVVRSDGGDVELVPARGRGVAVRETQRYLLEQPTLERDVEDGVLTLEARCEASFVTCVTDLRVSVPAGATLTLDTDSGDVVVAASALPRRILGATDSGDVRVVVPRGEYAVVTKTDSGDVDIGDGILRSDRAARSIDARTDSGDVTLTGG